MVLVVGGGAEGAGPGQDPELLYISYVAAGVQAILGCFPRLLAGS